MEKLDIEKRISEIRDMYKETVGDENNFSILLKGLEGSGKTSTICTAPKPILIDAFDPRCHIIVKQLLKPNEYLLRPFWDEKTSKPTQYSRWEAMWERDLASGFLDNFGTYAVDSVTTFTQSLSNQVSKAEGRSQGKLAIQDYNIIYGVIRDLVKMTSAQANCVFIMTAHLVNDRDDLTGEIIAELDLYKRLKSQLPLLFTEKYVMTSKETSSGVKYQLLTRPTGRFRASTQLGAMDKFEMYEEPDISKLIKKAGLKIEDKPLLD